MKTTLLSEALAVTSGAAAILAFACFALVLAPYMQLHDAPGPQGLRPYTEPELRGRAQYVALGCVYCHSQQPRAPSQAPDQARGWGRPSIPGDYNNDYPHLLGTMRTGPDLFNIGARQPSQTWHLLHLYQPRAVESHSVMPAFPFLFEVVETPSPDAVTVLVPEPWGPESGTVVAKPEALDLVAYLLALDHTYDITKEDLRKEMP